MDMQTEYLLSLMETCPILNCIEKGEKHVWQAQNLTFHKFLLDNKIPPPKKQHT